MARASALNLGDLYYSVVIMTAERTKPARTRIEIETLAGPFDRMTTVLEEFEPGQDDFIAPLERCGVASRSVERLVQRELEVAIPSRLHATVLDMNRFRAGKCGGGGVGVAVKIFNVCRIRTIDEPEVRVVSARKPLVEHFAILLRKLLRYPGGFEIELWDHERRHVGMGSSSGTISAVCVAINETLGRPFSNRELRRIIGYNFCEESPTGSGYLIQAFETGVGAMAGIYGGWVVASDDLELAYRVPLPDTKAIILIPDVPSIKNEYNGESTSARSEVELLLRRARYLDARQGHEKAYSVLLDLIPAMVKGDLEAMGKVMLDIAFIGSKRAECEQHGLSGANIYYWLGSFKQLGAELVAMSSVGPTTAALTRRPDVYNRILAFLKENNVPPSRIIETEVDNVGARIREKGSERTYEGESWVGG